MGASSAEEQQQKVHRPGERDTQPRGRCPGQRTSPVPGAELAMQEAEDAHGQSQGCWKDARSPPGRPVLTIQLSAAPAPACPGTSCRLQLPSAAEQQPDAGVQ